MRSSSGPLLVQLPTYSHTGIVVGTVILAVILIVVVIVAYIRRPPRR